MADAKPADADLDVLTPEEREALAHLEADSGNPATPSDADDATGAVTGAASATLEAETSQDQPVASTIAAPPAQADAAAAAPPAFPRFEAPKDAEATLSALSKQLADLDTAFDEGELTAAEFRVQTRALQDQERAIREQILMANMSEQARRQSYDTAVQSFLATNAQYQQGSQMFALLDAELRRIQTEAMAKGFDPLDPSLIHHAHASLQTLFGNAAGAAANPPAPPQTPVPPGAQRNLPPAFHSIPATATQDIADPVVSGLARLSGEDFEQAFARLPEATRQQFLARMN
jgi:hypothetical protein